MIAIRLGNERGSAKMSWLESYHTFSFGNYYDPNHMSFASLRVINEDFIQPSQGFGTHGHKDMEIVTYVLEGALEHKDSLGNGSIIRPGDIQRMTAGTGIQHSEYNASQSESVHLLQIWIVPDTSGLEPSYEQTHVSMGEQLNQLFLVGSRDGRGGSVTIHQNIDLYASKLSQNNSITHSLQNQRVAWLQVAKGAVQLNKEYDLEAGDAATLHDLNEIAVQGLSDEAEILLFDITV